MNPSSSYDVIVLGGGKGVKTALIERSAEMIGGSCINVAFLPTSFDAPSPDAYETLLWDVMKKDATLFMRADQVEAAWQLLMPVLEVWQATAPSEFPNYASGTWALENTQGLLDLGHRWPLPTEWTDSGKKNGKYSNSK
jgi:glucose-6-phosphate 1-dehydrogenase